MKRTKKLMMSLLLVLGMMMVGTVYGSAEPIGYGWRHTTVEITIFKSNSGGIWIITTDYAQHMQSLFYMADEHSDPVLVDKRFYGGTQNCLPEQPSVPNVPDFSAGSISSLDMQSMNGSNAEILNHSFELGNEDDNDW